MKSEIALAQLSIVDGAWQESPDNVAHFDESALFDGSPTRGSLYIVTEVTGEAEGRDALARELMETARREYAASRGSIMLGLGQAVRAANETLYNFNANAPREARRIAGMTAVILREDELFIAQAGPGLSCLVRDISLQCYPEESPWFDPNEEAIAQMITARDFPTDGAVPMGMRHNYNPDQFHVSLQPGDIFVISTRTLAHLLSNQELLDTLAQRHPDEIIASLEDLAGTLDLSVIALRVAESPAIAREQLPPLPRVVSAPTVPTPAPVIPPTRTPQEAPPPRLPGLMPDEEHEAPRGAVSEPKPSRSLPRVQIDWSRVRAGALRVSAGTMAALAAIFSRVDWKKASASIDRAVSNLSRALARALLFLLRSFLPGEPKEDKSARAAPPAMEGGWRLLAIAFPLLLILAGGAMWFTARAERQRVQAAQVADLITEANAAVASGKNLADSDKAAARDAFAKAIALIDQAKAINPNSPAVLPAYYAAQDEMDKLNGVSVMYYLPSFATYSDSKAKPARIVAHYPDVFVLDRGTSRVYHYVVNEAGPTVTPTPGDGIILKVGDKASDKDKERVVGELIDLTWVETGGRLIALDATGVFLEYDPAKSEWSAHAVRDAAQWSRVTLMTSYAGNLYLVDAGRNQILRYVQADDTWTSSTTYFAPGVNVDLSTVTDIAIDADVWLSRADGSISRFTKGAPSDQPIRDIDQPMTKSVAIVTSEKSNNLFVADAGNQRIVQIDKVASRFARQFKPTRQLRDAFNSLQALAADEPRKLFFFINGRQAYVATIPQP